MSVVASTSLGAIDKTVSSHHLPQETLNHQNKGPNGFGLQPFHGESGVTTWTIHSDGMLYRCRHDGTRRSDTVTSIEGNALPYLFVEEHKRYVLQLLEVHFVVKARSKT
jgi:hypothetical protein